MAIQFYHALIHPTVAPYGGSPRWDQSTSGPNDVDKGAMKAEGHARLEPFENPGHASLDFCTCVTGYMVHMVRADGRPTGTTKGRRDGASSSPAACLLQPYIIVLRSKPFYSTQSSLLN